MAPPHRLWYSDNASTLTFQRPQATKVLNPRFKPGATSTPHVENNIRHGLKQEVETFHLLDMPVGYVIKVRLFSDGNAAL